MEDVELEQRSTSSIQRAVRPAVAPAVQPIVTAPAVSNAAIARLAHCTPQMLTAVRVSQPDDPAEVEAEAVARRVTSNVGGSAGGPTASASPSGPNSQSASTAGSSLSAAVTDLIAAPGPGAPLDPGIQARIEPILGADLGPVRVHDGPEATTAAAELQARAFTVGSDVFLGAGESPTDLALLAHEATHVVQQQSVAVLRTTIARDFSVGGLAMAGVREAALEIPGYGLLTQIVGRDPLTGETVTVDRTTFVTALLGHGPFAGAIGPVLQGLDALDGVVALIGRRLDEHHLTLARLEHDFAAAWDEVKIIEGLDYNVAIITRYVDALLSDVHAFVLAIADDVLALVRAAAVHLVEPLLERPEVKPWWDLAIKVFHHDPLRGVDVQAPTVEILTDFLRLIGRESAIAQMTERGTLQSTADWLDAQWARFQGLLAQAGQLFADAWAAISPQNLASLPGAIGPLADRAVGLVHQVGAFAADVAVEVLHLVKDSLLGWLAQHADGVPGFHLLTVILGRNPFTGAPVARTPENLIRGFITLLPGGDAMYAELSTSGEIANAAGRIEAVMSRLGITWDMVTGTFLAIWNGLSLEDLIAPIAAFERIVHQFGEPLGRIVEFVSVVIQTVVELILRAMDFPSELLGHIIDNAMAALDDIERDPIAFLENVVLALKSGFSGFFDHVAGYLLRGLEDWLFGGLRALGIEPPTEITLQSVISLAIQVLGVTAEHLWSMLGERIGPERVAMIRGALDRLGQAWSFVKDVEERGIVAIWEFISGQLGNLWDTLLQRAKDWVMREIVDKVTTKLLSMLDPTGIMAIINGAVAFFRAIQSALQYLRQILQIVDGYVSTIASVAKGQIAPGAAMIEQGLANSVPVAIGFLANQAGLTNIPEIVHSVIISLREMVTTAIFWLFDQAMRLGQSALAALGIGDNAGGAAGEGGAVDAPVQMEGETHHLRNDGPGGELVLHSRTLLANTIDDPTVRAAVVAYNASTSIDERKRTALIVAAAVAAWHLKAGDAAGLGGDAPGLGDMERHGSKGSSLRNAGIPLWELESEHVIPFTIMKHAWVLGGIHSPMATRKQLSQEDGALTTIMIYRGAAGEKTGEEEGWRTRLAQALAKRNERYTGDDVKETPALDAEIVATIERVLGRAVNHYARLTRASVESENMKNGSRRVRIENGVSQAKTESELATGALPTLDSIKQTARDEVMDALDILRDALAESYA